MQYLDGSRVPESLQCGLGCCDEKAMWCGACASHCMGDEFHSLPFHEDTNCECEWDTMWDLGPGGVLIEVVGDRNYAGDLAALSPDHIIFWGPEDVADDQAHEPIEGSLVRVYQIALSGPNTPNGANPGALVVDISGLIGTVVEDHRG